MKISAIDFSLAGDKYLGRSYEEMDCQAFVEKCMADVGLRMDLGGSNSWYRECGKHGWVGTPEECVKEFGSVPKGALLFILEPVGPKTPAKFRNDGIGDVTHMGIVTGRGDGAIHSSSSRGCVATSKFRGKTIPNGGWNRVGLYDKFDYDGAERREEADAVFQEDEEEAGGEKLTGIVTAETGTTVNLRKTKGGKLLERIPIGSEVTILDYGEEWCQVIAGGLKGWMKTAFINAEGGEEEDELGDHCCCCDHCRICFSGGLYQQPEAGGACGLPAGKAGGKG